RGGDGQPDLLAAPHPPSVHTVLYRSKRRSRRLRTVPWALAPARSDRSRSAMVTVSTFSDASAATPSRAKGKSHGVRMHDWAYWTSMFSTLGRLPTLPDSTT